ncbi:MAG: protein translocase subunit SecF [Holosporaceae bacterium]|jgi:preprotein translocase SecF subunit|nr:protein translocase subunit SecF [Holosporaceae bacterium]
MQERTNHVELYKLIPHDTKIDFVAKRRFVFAFSILVTLTSILAFVFSGLNFGVDFRGGFVLEVRTPQAADVGVLRDKLGKLEIGEIYLQEFGSDRDLLIRMPASSDDQSTQSNLLEKVKETLGDGVEYRKIERIGPKVGKELVHDAILAVVISLLAILMYVWIRFEWQFAICGVIALAHDCIVLIGLYALVHYFEFSANAIVALLMTACYSIHDTVVVFDRIRENIAAYRSMSIVDLLNKSINETLSRTILTSTTTILSLLALCFFGGKVIFDFCFPILFGLAFGTFSSICLAAPLLLITGIRMDGKDLEVGLGDK